MATDLEQIQTIRTQTLAIIASLTANPKPTYYIDGQMVSWNAYLKTLQATVDWCERKAAGEEPFEIHSRGTT
jgi:hypothetical protein